MDEGPVRNTPDGAFVCSAGQRSVVDLDTGAHRGPVIEPLGLVHWHVDAPVRARIAERRAPGGAVEAVAAMEVLRSEEHTSELQSRGHLVCRLLLEKKKRTRTE